MIEILAAIEHTMEIFVARRRLGKAGVVVSDKAGQEGICCIDRANAGEAQLLYQPILQRMVRSFDSALCLAGIGAENLDVQLG